MALLNPSSRYSNLKIDSKEQIERKYRSYSSRRISKIMDRKTPHQDLLKAASPDHLGVILDKNGIADKIYSHLNGRYPGEVKSAEEINAFLKKHLNGLRMTDGFFVRTFENLSFAVKEDGTNAQENQKAYNVALNMSLFISTIGEVRLLEGKQAIFSAAQDVKAVDVSILC
jgi:hypothetical protein